jgi:hypothetical protein
MGRQWLQAKREVAHLKKGQVVGKLVKEIMVAPNWVALIPPEMLGSRWS